MTPPRIPLEKRFWRLVDIKGPEECWPWLASRGNRIRNGYGRISRPGRGSGAILAHRAAYEFTYGPIPKGPGYHGTCILHKCDNRICCNPAHLFLGTAAANMADMVAKGRSLKGQKNPKAKLTPEQVDLIRKSPVSNKKLAKTFNVSDVQIGNVKRGISWKS